MPPPRQLLPGKNYLTTRRCTQRQFLIRPSERINQIILFCLGYSAQKYGILLHAATFMGNHYHLDFTDPHRTLPKFHGWLNEFVAKCINVELGRRENLWAGSESYNCVRIEGEDDESRAQNILDKLIYVLANPVAAGLVSSAHLWPGVWSAPAAMGIPFKVKRPKGLFRANGPLPKSVTLCFVPPPDFEHLERDEYQQLLQERLEEREEEIRAEFKAEGRTFKGQKAVLAQSPYEVAQSPEPKKELNPQISCREKRKRIELLEMLKEFLWDYRQAWKRFCAGEHDVVFPAGTYKMQVQYGVACAMPP